MKSFLKLHWPLPAIVLAFLIAAIWTNGGGYLLYGEMDHFLIDHNTDQRSWISKVLCPHRQDAENYMARELAHAIENIDARFAHFCVMNGMPHFLSLSSYAALAVIASIFWFTAFRLGMNRLTTSLLLMLLFTTPCIFMSSPLMRPGHTVATMLMVALVALLFYRYHGRHDPEPFMQDHAFIACVFILSLFMVWVDRQGLAAACSIAAIYWFQKVDRLPRRMVCTAIVSAILIHTFWYFFIGRNLVAHFTPFSDAIIPKNILAVSDAHKNMKWENVTGGFAVTFSGLKFMLGNIPAVLSVGAAAIMAFAFRRQWWVVASVVVLVSGMNFILLGCVPFLWPDCIRALYYHIIGVTALWLILSRAVCEFESHKATPWILGFLVLSNIFALPGHVSTYRNGHLVGFISGAPFMREMLKKTVALPDGTSTNRYNALESAQFTDWNWIMKNPLEYGGKLTAQEFVESSQYLQFVRSEKHLPFARGGRGHEVKKP